MAIASLLAGFSIFFILFFSIFIITGVVLTTIGKWKVLKKAGKNGWEALIPYYSTWVFCEVASVKWWFFLIILGCSLLSGDGNGFLSLLLLVAGYFINYNIALKFGKEPVGYAFGLTLLPFIFYPILGMGSAKYTDVKVSAYGPVSESSAEKVKEEVKEKTTNKSENNKFCKNCGAPLDSESKFCSSCGKEVQ